MRVSPTARKSKDSPPEANDQSSVPPVKLTDIIAARSALEIGLVPAKVPVTATESTAAVSASARSLSATVSVPLSARPASVSARSELSVSAWPTVTDGRSLVPVMVTVTSRVAVAEPSLAVMV